MDKQAAEKHNIVILSAFGRHDVAARAIKEQFDLRYKDCEVIIIPMNEYAGRFMMNLNEGFFTFCCRFAPWLYGAYFGVTAWRLSRKLRRLGKKYEELGRDSGKVKEGSAFYPLKRLKNIYERFEPKVIVSVHSLAQGLAVSAKKKYKFDCKVLAVISDYALDKLYVRFGCDGYAVGNEEIKAELNELGIEDDKIGVYGLPAFNKFLVRSDKKQAREHFGLPDRTTVIVSGGSLGAVKMKGIFRRLLEDFKDVNVVAVAGRNEKLKACFEKIKEKSGADNAYVLGFTTEFNKLLDAADAMVCKPGSMSVNEAFLKGVPVISVYPMPSVEALNEEYFIENDLCLLADNPGQASEQLKILLKSSGLRQEYADKMTSHSKRDAAKNIADYIYSLISAEK